MNHPIPVLVSLSLLIGGCLGATPANPPLGPTVAATDALSTSVEFQGKTGTQICVTTTLVPVCQFGEPGTAEHVELGTHGSRHLYGNLTWVPATPATAELVVFIVLDDRLEEESPKASGPDPLRIDFDLRPFQGRNVAVGVAALRCRCVQGNGVEQSLPQEFLFRGEYVGTRNDASAS